jgi:DNA-binding winged helix-turn-helix (wHTH) protein
VKIDEYTAVPRELRYRFGEFELDLNTYALTRGGRPLKVRRKVFDVLRFLIEHRERVVPKEELLDAVWPDSQVTEVSVPWTVSHARRILGQSTADTQPIETVHGRGYRFVAEVEVLSARASERAPAHGLSSQVQAPESPFVGRQEAMASLHARLVEASTGRGALVALVGEGGIGKTRCVDELAVRAREEGFAVWSGRSTEDTVAPVFWPWMQVFRDIAHERPALREAAEGLLARLCARNPSPDVTDLQLAPGSFWLFDGVSSLLRDAAGEGPVLLLLEDLHWADVGSIQLLAFISPELQEHAVLVVTTQRDGRSAGHTRELRRLSRHAARIELEPLTPDEVGQYVGLVAQTGAADAELSAALHRATAGNPLFLLQTVRGLVARHGRDKLGSLAPELVKPAESARDVLRSGLDALNERARRVLEVASVLGEYFELSTLQELCGIKAEELLAALEAASEEAFVVAEQPNEFRFRHALLRAALYDDLAASDRANQHRRAAQVLERSAHDRGRHGEIAHHYYRSLALGDYGRVAAAAEQAAHAAARLQAFSDAANFCGWALEAQALDHPQQPRTRAELLRLHGQFEQLAGNGQDALHTIGLLVDIAREHGYTDLLLDAARIIRPTHLMGARPDTQVCTILEDALRALPEGANALRIKALSQLSWTPPYALDMQRSKELSGDALALARQRSEPDSLVVALHARLYALSGPDDIDALLEVTDEMLRRDGSPRTWVSLEALSARHAALIHRGELVQADAAHAAYGHLAREQKWPEAIWSHDRLCAQRKLLEGDFAGAEAAIRELRARSLRLRLSHGAALIAIMRAALTIQRDGPRVFASRWETAPFWLTSQDSTASVRPGIGRLCASLGQHGPAKSVLESMVGDGGFALPKETSYLNAVANLGVLAIGLADRPRAERIYEELAAYPHHNTPDAVMLCEGSVSHFLAQLAAFLGLGERVARHFDDALAMNERLGLRPQLAHSYCAYARWLLASTRAPSRKIGRDLQARAIELAETLGMSWLAAAARAAG